ncbi:MAG: hypothetical protein ACLUOJ_03910 [Streptococcus salivarius]
MKVRAAMEELGYVPNSAAQFATGLTHSLGVIPPLTDRKILASPSIWRF